MACNIIIIIIIIIFNIAVINFLFKTWAQEFNLTRSRLKQKPNVDVGKISENVLLCNLENIHSGAEKT